MKAQIGFRWTLGSPVLSSSDFAKRLVLKTISDFVGSWLDLADTLQIRVTDGTFRRKIFKDNTYLDEFGIRWRIHEYIDFIPVYHPIQSYEDFDDFLFPDPEEPWRFDVFYENVEKYGDGFFIPGGIGFTPFERAWLLPVLSSF